MSRISVTDLASYVVDELEQGADNGAVARKLASYLIDNKQSRDAAKVLRAVEVELHKRGKSQVEITSVHEVSDAVKSELAYLLGVNAPIFSETIDPSVIGGVKARSGETEIDLTVKNKLNKFKIATRRA
jgi:F0F1-type ATP synthase delta subunit